MKIILTIVLALTYSLAAANEQDVVDKVFANSQEGPKTRELNWLNENFLEKQRKDASALIAAHFGQQLHGDKKDITLLQRVVNDELIPRNDTLQLQALGVVLGDIYVKENPVFQWRIYEDELGPSQAVCIKDSVHCLFPITMLSRRMELGLKPNVQRIYNKGMEEMALFLPRMPYSVKK